MPDDYLPGQEERRVESPPNFNGTACFICIDVPAICNQQSDQWGGRWLQNHSLPPLTDDDFANAVLADFDQKAAACPPGSNIKVQFLFHYSSKMVNTAVNGQPKLREHSQSGCVEKVLRAIAARPNPRVTKVYLTCCSSHGKKEVVDAAFSIPTVTHVVTVDNTILLQCGAIIGTKWGNDQPTFQPDEVSVIVWIRDGTTQVAQVPTKRVGKDEKFDIGTNLTMDKTQACPSVHNIAGTGAAETAYMPNAAIATAVAQAVANALAANDLAVAVQGFICPPVTGCQTKQVLSLTLTITGTTTSTPNWFERWFMGRAGVAAKSTYSWTAQVMCKP